MNQVVRRPMLQDMVKAAMAGAAQRVSVTEEARLQAEKLAEDSSKECPKCHKEKCACMDKKASASNGPSTEHVEKLAGALEYLAEELETKEAEKNTPPPEGVSASNVSGTTPGPNMGKARHQPPAPSMGSSGVGPANQMANDMNHRPGGTAKSTLQKNASDYVRAKLAGEDKELEKKETEGMAEAEKGLDKARAAHAQEKSAAEAERGVYMPSHDLPEAGRGRAFLETVGDGAQGGAIAGALGGGVLGAAHGFNESGGSTKERLARAALHGAAGLGGGAILGGGLGGASVAPGAAVGSMTGSKALGTLGGAGLGAMAGSHLYGPEGAIIGGLMGGVGGYQAGHMAGGSLRERGEAALGKKEASALVDYFIAKTKVAATKLAEDAINPAQISAGKAVAPETSASGESGGAPAGGAPQGPTGLIGSNEAAMNYKRNAAYANRKSDMGKYLSEPMMSGSTDTVLQQAFSHAGEAGHKFASAAEQTTVKTAAAHALLAKLEEAAAVDGKKGL